MTHSSSLPPLEGLAALIAAAEQGSFTGAADMLGLTHGSVSRRVAAVEAWLGVPVFERHGRGVHLTPAGQRFLTEARQAIAILGQSAERWRPRLGRPTVRLSVVPSFARLWLLPRLAHLEQSDLRVEVLASHRPADLEGRESDLAIRYGGGNWDGVDARLLMAETLAPVAIPTLAEEIGAALESLTLDRLPPLLHDSDSSQWRVWLKDVGIRYRPRWQDRRFEDYDTVLAAARAGLGVALLRLPLAQAQVADGHLVHISKREAANPRSHFLCRRPVEERGAVLELAERIRIVSKAKNIS